MNQFNVTYIHSNILTDAVFLANVKGIALVTEALIWALGVLTILFTAMWISVAFIYVWGVQKVMQYIIIKPNVCTSVHSMYINIIFKAFCGCILCIRVYTSAPSTSVDPEACWADTVTNSTAVSLTHVATASIVYLTLMLIFWEYIKAKNIHKYLWLKAKCNIRLRSIYTYMIVVYKNCVPMNS